MSDLGGRLQQASNIVKGSGTTRPTPVTQPTQPEPGSTASAAVSAVGGAAALATGVAGEVIKAAESALGKPYVWGGNDLNSGVDCSGLVQQAYKAAGINLPRVSNDQARAGAAVSYQDAQPGDILWWDFKSDLAGADHVAIYLGNGMMIEALHRGAPVHIVPVRTPTGVTRVTGSSDIVSTDQQREVGPNDSLPARLAAISAAMTPQPEPTKRTGPY